LAGLSGLLTHHRREAWESAPEAIPYTFSICVVLSRIAQKLFDKIIADFAMEANAKVISSLPNYLACNLVLFGHRQQIVAPRAIRSVWCDLILHPFLEMSIRCAAIGVEGTLPPISKLIETRRVPVRLSPISPDWKGILPPSHTQG
jgi:hypothetical protein